MARECKQWPNEHDNTIINVKIVSLLNFQHMVLYEPKLAEMVTIMTVLEKLPVSFLKVDLQEDIKLFQNTRNYYNFAIFRRHQ